MRQFGGVGRWQRSQGELLPKRSTPCSLCPLSGIVSRPQARVQPGVSQETNEWARKPGRLQTRARQPRHNEEGPVPRYSSSLGKCFPIVAPRRKFRAVERHRKTRADQWTSRGLPGFIADSLQKWSVPEGRWKTAFVRQTFCRCSNSMTIVGETGCEPICFDKQTDLSFIAICKHSFSISSSKVFQISIPSKLVINPTKLLLLLLPPSVSSLWKINQPEWNEERPASPVKR